MRELILLLAFSALLTGCVGGDSPPQLNSGSGYGYPDAAKQTGTEGKVTVRYDIDVNGVVHNAVVVAADPPGVFDENALKTVRSWKFTPRRVNGGAVVQRGLTSDVTFKLSGEDKYKGY